MFGVTRSGFCGNPLTQMASFYLSEELKKQITSGANIIDSLNTARNKTVSKLTKEMDISTQKGVRHLQGLKKGMFHDDTPEEMSVIKKVIQKFPANPWS
jgi:polyhydroxyalkanoate synthesis regulator phasin